MPVCTAHPTSCDCTTRELIPTLVIEEPEDDTIRCCSLEDTTSLSAYLEDEDYSNWEKQ